MPASPGTFNVNDPSAVETLKFTVTPEDVAPDVVIHRNGFGGVIFQDRKGNQIVANSNPDMTELFYVLSEALNS